VLVSGCGTLGRSTKWSEEEKEILRLEQLLLLTSDELAARESQIVALREDIVVLERSIGDTEADILALLEQEAIATEARAERDEEIAALKSERDSLLMDLARLSNAAEVAASQAAAAQVEAQEAADAAAQAQARLAEQIQETEELASRVAVQAEREKADSEAAATVAANREALADAIDGLGGFRPVETLGFTTDARMGARLAVAGSGLAVDTSGDAPVLYDQSLQFDSSLVYLTITDPAGNDPVLTLTVQYVSDERPLYTRTAFISIEGHDPIDPIDPVIFTGTPERKTDGERVLESFSRSVDRQLLAQISRMLSSENFASTFVGTVGRDSHEPSSAEREALSRVLFAFIDLGGFR
jgi:hypothetical protein